MRVSPAKVAANRRNARRSTGPITTFGRLKSSYNARRHGLSIATALTPEVRQLALAILDDVPLDVRTPALENWAHLIARAEFDIERARSAKRSLYAQIPQLYRGAVASEAMLHEGAAGGRLLSDLTDCGSASAILASAVQEIRRIDRYEKRAIARRRKAARTFRTQARAAMRRLAMRAGREA